MIASERTQNMIVVTVILVTIISSVPLINNATYYGGSYSLAEGLEVNLLEVKVTNVNHTEGSSDPGVSLTFNLRTESLYEGNVRITFMGASLRLNEDLLSYTPVSFVPAPADQYLSPEFDRNYTLTKRAISEDREAILDADTSGTWNWEIHYRYSFIVFDQPETIIFRYLDFNTTMTTIVYA